MWKEEKSRKAKDEITRRDSNLLERKTSFKKQKIEVVGKKNKKKLHSAVGRK